MKKLFVCLFLFVSFITEAQTVINWNFKNVNSHNVNIPIVTLKVGKDSCNFIIDSGSNLSILDNNWKQSNRKYIKKVSYSNIAIGTLNGNSTVNNEICHMFIDDIQYVFFIADLKNINDRTILSEYDIIGIIGSDFLRRNNMIIDYKTRTIHN